MEMQKKIGDGVLIVTPKSTLVTWKREVEKLLPHLKQKIFLPPDDDSLRRDQIIELIPTDGRKV